MASLNRVSSSSSYSGLSSSASLSSASSSSLSSEKLQVEVTIHISMAVPRLYIEVTQNELIQSFMQKIFDQSKNFRIPGSNEPLFETFDNMNPVYKTPAGKFIQLINNKDQRAGEIFNGKFPSQMAIKPLLTQAIGMGGEYWHDKTTVIVPYRCTKTPTPFSSISSSSSSSLSNSSPSSSLSDSSSPSSSSLSGSSSSSLKDPSPQKD